jgi:aspartate aminotransferase
MATPHSATPHSATLAIDQAVAARRRSGHTVLHLGFGEAGLPVPPGLIDVLTEAGASNSYPPVVGTTAAREAAAGWFTRRGLATDAGQIIFAPGSKPLLFALLAAIEGDVVLPRPAWVTYAAQAALLNRGVVSVPVADEAGGIPDPRRFEDDLRTAKADGATPGVLVITVPDNPTGTVPSPAAVEEVCAIAERHGLAIICDEIYAELVHHGRAPRAATYLPERTVITTGLSKSLALGGWRIGYARIPDSPWGHTVSHAITGVASEVWSSLAAPMQAVAAYALTDPVAITARISASRALHARIATAVHAELVGAGADCRPPQAGFYLYPDFGSRRAELAARGITTSPQLAAALLEQHDIATLPGSAFGDDPDALTLRIATSLLYGITRDERLSALASDNPRALPWIARDLNHLHHGLSALLAS